MTAPTTKPRRAAHQPATNPGITNNNASPRKLMPSYNVVHGASTGIKANRLKAKRSALLTSKPRTMLTTKRVMSIAPLTLEFSGARSASAGMNCWAAAYLSVCTHLTVRSLGPEQLAHNRHRLGLQLSAHCPALVLMHT